MKIIIEAYNPEWKVLFEKEKTLLTEALFGVDFQIEHIGSTSVEGLGAKPIIDILIGLNDFSLADHQIEKVVKSGYQYIGRYEEVMPYRRFFVKELNEIRTHHIHMVGIDTEFWRRHLAFREHLKTNSIDMLRYYNFKKELSKRDWIDGNEYANAKTAFIRDIEIKINAARIR